jgi:glycosyltransferase involved in cell wall biosynthesis
MKKQMAGEPDMETRKLTVSVVVATYNRTSKLPVLLRSLSAQSLPREDYELILVDDGSREPAKNLLEANPTPFATRLVEQTNSGQAVARDRGVREAKGDVIVILDDDMEFQPTLLENHLAWHQKGYRVVLGRIDSARDIEKMPLFERFHAEQLERHNCSLRDGARPRGVHLCTGNVSFRREDYLAIGGFDHSLKRSEDRDLGVRLELSGATLVFGDDVATVHDSDHSSLEVWLKRAYDYGVYDHRIHKKHPTLDIANPWSYLFLVSPLSRPLMLVSAAAPSVGSRLSTYGWRTSELCDQYGLKRAAIKGATFVYGLEYFRGLRHDAGSLSACLDELLSFWRTRKA